MKHIPARTLAIVLAGVTASSLVVAPNAAAAPDGSLPVISEVYGGGGNNGALYSHDFVELFNPTSEDVDLDGWAVQYFSASGNLGNTTPLTGTIPAGGHYLIQQNPGSNTGLPALPTPDVVGTANMSGSQGSVKLIDAAATRVDLVGWGDATLFEGAAAPGTTNATSAQRVNNLDTDDNSVDFIVDAPTPMTSVEEEPVIPADPVTLSIAEIQGTGAATPVAGQVVTTQGVVTAVYAEGGFNGYYLQTPGTGTELKQVGDASDAICVYVGSAGPFPEIGASLTVTGTASEHYGLTQLGSSSFVEATEPFAAVTPLAIDTMPAGDDIREAYEGMLVQPTGAYTVTNNYALNTFGEIGLAAGTEAYMQATEVELPGQAALDFEAMQAAELVTLDDGRSGNYTRGDNTTPMPWIVQDGSTIKSIRTGDQVDFQSPVIFDYRFDLWKFQPTLPVSGDTAGSALPITWEDSRAEALTAIDNVAGEFHIASFNVLNYFTSLGQDEEGCSAYTDINGNPVTANYCDVRGAYSQQAFEDQQSKIVAAINKLDVDVLGLEEIENTFTVTGDITRRDEALNKLVDALNTAAGNNRWAAVESPATPGTDEDFIRVAFIYDQTTVKPVGESRIFDDAAYTGTARQPLAQEFQPLDESLDSFVGIVNHFKSKGSVANNDADTGDGQGNNAQLRVNQSEALLAHLDAQADWADKPVFIIGDTNAYTREDAMTTLYEGGFTNIVTEYDAGTTYQFSGRLGSLDHALGNDRAMDLVVDAEVWDINADESIAFEYSRRLNNIVDVFEADTVFRSSDHDPIKVGFNLSPVEEPASSGSSIGLIATLLGALALVLPWIMELPMVKAFFK